MAESLAMPAPVASLVEGRISALFPHVSINRVPGRGRCVFAEKRIKAGEIVLASAAAASVVLPSERRCALCIFDGASNVCTSCRNQGSARYCTREHQKAGWSVEHKFEDKLLAKLDGFDDDTVTKVLLLSRLWRGSRMVPAAGGDAPPPSPFYRHSFADVLAMHRDTRLETLAECRRVAQLAIDCGVLSAEAGSTDAKAALGKDKLDVEDAVVVLSAFDSNNFMISDDLAHGRGAGVFPAGALLNHSCAPNAVISYGSERDHRGREIAWKRLPATATPPPAGYDGQILQVIRALRDIEPGEEVCHAFVDIALPLRERRRALQATYGFACTCELCKAEDAAEGKEYSVESLNEFPRRALEATSSGRLLPSPTLYQRPSSASSSLPGSGSASGTVLTPPMVGKGETRLRAAGRLLRLELCHALTVTGEHASERSAQVKELIRMLQLLCEAEVHYWSHKEGSRVGSDGGSAADEEALVAVVMDNTKPLVDRVVAACTGTFSTTDHVAAEIRKVRDLAKVSVSASVAVRQWRELLDGWKRSIPLLVNAYEFPAFLRHWQEISGQGSVLGGGEEERGAMMEVSAIETALTVMRWNPCASQSDAASSSGAGKEAGAEEGEDLSCHPSHLCVQAAVNNLLPRYLLLQDTICGIAACESIIASYDIAYRPISISSSASSGVATHPMKGLQLYTAADLVSDLLKCTSGLISAGVGKAVKGKADPFSLPLIPAPRWERIKLMFGPLKHDEPKEDEKKEEAVDDDDDDDDFESSSSKRKARRITSVDDLGSTKVPRAALEEAKERRAAGKPPTGRTILGEVVYEVGCYAQQASTDLYFQCHDQLKVTHGSHHPLSMSVLEKNAMGLF